MLDHELRDGGVVGRRHIEGRGHDLAPDGALHVGDLLGALVHQQAEEVHLGVVRGDRLADLLEDRGLARLGGRDDQATLALADGSDQIDGTTRDGILAVLHVQALVGEDGRQVAEARTGLHFLGSATVDHLDPLQGRILRVVVAGGTDGAHDHVTRAQTILADDLLVHEGVIVTDHVVARAKEGVALVLYLKDAGDLLEALSSGSGLVDGLDQLCLLYAHVLHAQLCCLAPELGHLHSLQVFPGKAGFGASLLATAVAAVATVVAAALVALAALVTLVTVPTLVAVSLAIATAAATFVLSLLLAGVLGLAVFRVLVVARLLGAFLGRGVHIGGSIVLCLVVGCLLGRLDGVLCVCLASATAALGSGRGSGLVGLGKGRDGRSQQGRRGLGGILGSLVQGSHIQGHLLGCGSRLGLCLRIGFACTRLPAPAGGLLLFLAIARGSLGGNRLGFDIGSLICGTLGGSGLLCPPAGGAGLLGLGFGLSLGRDLGRGLRSLLLRGLCLWLGFSLYHGPLGLWLAVLRGLGLLSRLLSRDCLRSFLLRLAHTFVCHVFFPIHISFKTKTAS